MTMKLFNENDGVIYTDAEGRRIDTFVIFDTDQSTGLTHINHENLKVQADKLVLHPNTVPRHHLPIRDAFSFEIFRKLKDKYVDLDSGPVKSLLPAKAGYLKVLAKAS